MTTQQKKDLLVKLLSKEISFHKAMILLKRAKTPLKEIYMFCDVYNTIVKHSKTR